MTGPVFRQKTLSLKGHFHLYLAAMLALIIVLWVTAYASLQATVSNFQEVTDREFIELRRLVFLRDVTHSSIDPIYRYMAWGKAHESGLFEQAIEEVDLAFTDVLVLPSLTAEQQELITSAQGEWQHAVSTGRAIFALENIPEQRSDLIAAGHMFDGHVTTVINTLYEAHNIRIANIEQKRVKAASRHRTTGFVMLASFLVGLAVFGIAGLTLARHVLSPLGIIRAGIIRYREGDLTHRIALVGSNELGELARGINEMADRLEQDQIKLAQLAVRDSLTDLYNRREFDRLLEEEVHRALRYRHPLSMLLIDIDHFKEVNDGLGHRAGDQALRLVSAAIREISRKGDVLGRYGGDELTVLLPETPIEDAMILAERIRRRISGQELRTDDGRTMRLTLSIGVATTSAEIDNSEKLVDAADHAMYLAKTGGRNRVRRTGTGRGDLPLAMS